MLFFKRFSKCFRLIQRIYAPNKSELQVYFFISKLSKELVGIQESVIRDNKILVSFAVYLMATYILSNSSADVLNNCCIAERSKPDNC